MSVMTKEEFVREVLGYTLHMYRLAYSILNNSTDAEDAVSEAVLHAYEKLRTLRDPDSFKNWILQITVNEAKKIYRQNKRTGAVAWEENLSPKRNLPCLIVLKNTKRAWLSMQRGVHFSCRKRK